MARADSRAIGASSAVNRFFDALPRPRLFRGSCERPAFRSLGVAGYYLALVATLGTGLLAGLSLLVLAAVAVVCAASFFGWAYLRRAITGRETLVLLEHAWAAELASAGTLYLLREPILPYLDAVSVGLAVFLMLGRLGCLLAGCCHGEPASIGIRYGHDCARDGFPAHLAGVRLFPVQAIEALGLCGIAFAGFGFAVGSTPGRALAWFLLAYAVLRFGLEGLRGDTRPHLFGLSQARWMALVELGVAFAIGERGVWPAPGRVAAALLLGVTLLVALGVARRFDPRRRLLSPAHVAEVRAVARAVLERAKAAGSSPVPEVGQTAQQVSVGASIVDDGRAVHLSIALPPNRAYLRLLCDITARALPELDAGSGCTSPVTLLHVRVPLPLHETPARAAPAVADVLYGAVLRRLQAEDQDDREPVAELPPASAVRTAEVPAVRITEVPAVRTPAPEPHASTEPAPPQPAEANAASDPPTPRPANGSPSPWDRRIPAAIEDELRRPWRRTTAKSEEEPSNPDKR